MSSLATRIKSDLTAAMRARDKVRVAVLRTVVAAIANAEAQPGRGSLGGESSERIAGASVGVGTTETDRRELTEADVRQVVAAERDERLSAARVLVDSGAAGHAERLHSEAAVLDAYL